MTPDGQQAVAVVEMVFLAVFLVWAAVVIVLALVGAAREEERWAQMRARFRAADPAGSAGQENGSDADGPARYIPGSSGTTGRSSAGTSGSSLSSTAGDRSI